MLRLVLFLVIQTISMENMSLETISFLQVNILMSKKFHSTNIQESYMLTTVQCLPPLQQGIHMFLERDEMCRQTQS